jgi:hypothetical protein
MEVEGLEGEWMVGGGEYIEIRWLENFLKNWEKNCEAYSTPLW